MKFVRDHTNQFICVYCHAQIYPSMAMQRSCVWNRTKKNFELELTEVGIRQKDWTPTKLVTRVES